MSYKNIPANVMDIATRDMFDSDTPLSRPQITIKKTRSHLSGDHLKSDFVRVLELDPKKCMTWYLHDRNVKWFTQENCKDLIDSIVANGQQEPGLVRRIKNDPVFEYEIISGARRHFACSNISGKPFLARETEASDQECAVLMHIENADRQDISDFERAVSVAKMLEAGIFSSQEQIATKLNLSKSSISQFVGAAQIVKNPKVMSLFPDVTALSIVGAYGVAQAMKAYPEKAMALANELGAEKLKGKKFSTLNICQKFRALNSVQKPMQSPIQYKKRGDVLTIKVNLKSVGFSFENLSFDIEGYLKSLEL